MLPAQLFNWFEAAFWLLLAIVVVVVGVRRARAGRSRHPRLHAVAGPTLAIFGISDIVEVYTGAWWEPWWLLLMKGTCLAVLVGCGLVLLRDRRVKVQRGLDA